MPPVSDAALTDVATLKAWLKIGTADNAVDGLLNRLITATSGTFLRLVNRPKFILGAQSEVHNGNNTFRLFLNVWPVVSITTVVLNSQALTPYSASYPSGYLFDEYGLVGNNYRFFKGYQYSVVYTGGFSPVSSEAFAAEQAVISLCSLWYKRKDHADQIAQSLGQQITAKYTEDELPPETRAIIQSLKRNV